MRLHRVEEFLELGLLSPKGMFIGRGAKRSYELHNVEPVLKQRGDVSLRVLNDGHQGAQEEAAHDCVQVRRGLPVLRVHEVHLTQLPGAVLLFKNLLLGL